MRIDGTGFETRERAENAGRTIPGSFGISPVATPPPNKAGGNAGCGLRNHLYRYEKVGCSGGLFAFWAAASMPALEAAFPAVPIDAFALAHVQGVGDIEQVVQPCLEHIQNTPTGCIRLPFALPERSLRIASAEQKSVHKVPTRTSICVENA
jgi:hypothetical protein